MPAHVPPGYTRGPILFIAPTTNSQAEDDLLQVFWRAAGSYGSRILLVSIGQAEQTTVETIRARLRSWESDSVAAIAILNRQDAQQQAHQEPIEQATGILLLTDDAQQAATLIGGTPLAQALRRANARSKVLAAARAAMPFLCQHMPVHLAQPTPDTQPENRKFYFTPGLGLVNRLVIDTFGPSQTSEQRLLAAAAANPFIIALALAPNGGAIVNPDNSLTILGTQPAILVDAANMTYTNLHESNAPAFTVEGAAIHHLPPAYSFHLDTRTVQAPTPGDLPRDQDRVTSAF
jgi:cyanophycinase